MGWHCDRVVKPLLDRMTFFVLVLSLLWAVAHTQQGFGYVDVYNNGSKVVFASESADEVLVEVQGSLDVTGDIHSVPFEQRINERIDGKIANYGRPTEALIATHGASDMAAYSLNGAQFLAVANSHNAANTSHHTASKVYTLGESGEWEEYQSLPSVGARSVSFFQVAGQDLLAVAHHFNGSTYDIDSPLRA